LFIEKKPHTSSAVFYFAANMMINIVIEFQYS